MRRIVRKELLETLLVNNKLIKINAKPQIKIDAFQSVTQEENINIKINIDQFTQTDQNQCITAFATELDKAESIRFNEMVDDFQLPKYNIEYNDDKFFSEEFIFDATKQWVLKYRHY
ncbi:hypothetical protein PUN28_003589 [Cardiocondyla obscurior]|uniref:Uncharacterized protein n=1 Tax=Cardiocondyla obscurior TaxID=286306 RepID=A0AAW2GN68_9HYME